MAICFSGNGMRIRMKLPGDTNDLDQAVTVTCKMTVRLEYTVRHIYDCSGFLSNCLSKFSRM